WRGQIRNKTKTGGYYWGQTTIVPMTDENNQPYQLLSFRLDITTQKLVAEQLAESNNRLSILTDNFPNGSVSLIDPELNLLFSGGAGYDAVDFLPEDVIGRPLQKALSPETYTYILAHLRLMMKGQTMHHNTPI